MSRDSHSIFCLEGDWHNDMNRSSTVRPILELVNQHPFRKIDYIHRDVGTAEEFEYYCKKWIQSRMRKFDILYLAFHGSPEGALHVGDQRKKTKKTNLESLAAILGPNLKGRIIHFGSCETLAIDRRHVLRFVRETGVLAVTGYRRSVDWMFSAAFEVLFFEAITRYPFTRRGMAMAEKEMRTCHSAMCKRLDFRMVISEGRSK